MTLKLNNVQYISYVLKDLTSLMLRHTNDPLLYETTLKNIKCPHVLNVNFAQMDVQLFVHRG